VREVGVTKGTRDRGSTQASGPSPWRGGGRRPKRRRPRGRGHVGHGELDGGEWASRRQRTDGCCGNDRDADAEGRGHGHSHTHQAGRASQVGKTGMRARKAHSLISQSYDMRNLERAWQTVRENKGRAGVDGMAITRFEANREHYLAVLHRRLKDGRQSGTGGSRTAATGPGRSSGSKSRSQDRTRKDRSAFPPYSTGCANRR